MTARKPLPETDHVTRFVPRKRQHWDVETGQFLGIDISAFALRPQDEGGLSTTWVEYFGSYGQTSKELAAASYRKSLQNKTIPANGLFASGNVDNILDAGKRYSNTLRVIRSPSKANPGHAIIRQFTDDDLELLGFLADSVFIDIDFVADMNIP